MVDHRTPMDFSITELFQWPSTAHCHGLAINGGDVDSRSCVALLLVTFAALRLICLRASRCHRFAISALGLNAEQWWRCFVDPRPLLYVLFGVALTTGLGALRGKWRSDMACLTDPAAH